MAYPQVVDADTKSGTVTSNSSSWTLTYPTNLQSGDLILALMAVDGATNFPAGAWPAGWTADSAYGGGPVMAGVASKVSDGTETGTFSVGLTGSEQGSWRVLRIVGWYGSGLQGANVSGGANYVTDGRGVSLTTLSAQSSSTPDPPSDSPTNWDSETTLWLSVIAVDTSRTISGYPSNMPLMQSQLASGGSNGATLGIAMLESDAASVDPGTFTISSSDDWAAATIAIRPKWDVDAFVTDNFDDVDFGGPAPGSVNLTNPTLVVGDSSSSRYDRTVGLRFVNVAIDQGATVDLAYLVLNAVTAGPSQPIVIDGQDDDSPATFSSSYSDATGRARTTASVNWTAVTGGYRRRTIDLSAIIEEIVGRSGWQSGNALVLFLNDPTTAGWTSADQTVFSSYQGSTAISAELVVNWTPGTGGGGTETPQSVSGSLTFSGSVGRLPGKGLSASLTFSGTWGRLATLARSWSATVTFAGSARKQSQRGLAGGLSFSGAIGSIKSVLKALSGALTFTGSVVRSPRRTLAAVLTFAGSSAKRTARALPGSLSFSGSAVRRTSRSLSAAVTYSGAAVRSTARTLAAGLTFAGSLAKRVPRALAAALTFAGSVGRQTRRTVAGALTFAEALGRAVRRPIAAAVSFTGSIRSVTGKPLSAGLTFAGAAARQTRRSLAGAVNFSGVVDGIRNVGPQLYEKALTGSLTLASALSRSASRVLDPASAHLSFSSALSQAKVVVKAIAGALTFAGSVTKRGTRSVSAALTFAGAAAPQARKALAASLGLAGSVTRVASRPLAAAVSFAGNATKATTRSIAAALTFTGSVLGQKVTQVFHQAVGGALAFAGSVSRRTNRPLTGAVTFTGAVGRAASRRLVASLTFAGAVAKRGTRFVTGSLSFAGSHAGQKIAGLYLQAVNGTLAFSGAIAKQTGRTSAAALTFAGAVARGSRRALAASLAPVGTLGRSTAKATTAALVFSGSVVKATARGLAAAVSFVVAASGRLMGTGALTSIGGRIRDLLTSRTQRGDESGAVQSAEHADVARGTSARVRERMPKGKVKR